MKNQKIKKYQEDNIQAHKCAQIECSEFNTHK